MMIILNSDKKEAIHNRILIDYLKIRLITRKLQKRYAIMQKGSKEETWKC